MTEKVITSPTDKELFSISVKRIFASCLCGVGIHQRWLYVDRNKSESFWYCSHCGKISNKVNVEIK